MTSTGQQVPAFAAEIDVPDLSTLPAEWRSYFQAMRAQNRKHVIWQGELQERIAHLETGGADPRQDGSRNAE